MKAKLIKKITEASGTKSFFWKTASQVNYLPGQFFYYTLPKLDFSDERGATRDFTASSSPTEGKLIRLTTRIRKGSGYKQTLDKLPIGTKVEFEGPTGTFIIDENETGPHVFLAGGIGITPFRSALKYKFDKNLDYAVYLLYSNSVPEEIAFRKELEGWHGKLHFELLMTITKPEESKLPWSGLKGRIDEKLITQSTSQLTNPTFWLCGPPTFVDAMEALLRKLKIAEGKIRSDKFTGY